MSRSGERTDTLARVLASSPSLDALERFGVWWQGPTARAEGYRGDRSEDLIRYCRALQAVAHEGLRLLSPEDCYVDAEFWVFMDDSEAIYSWGLKLVDMEEGDPLVYLNDMDFQWVSLGTRLAQFLLELLCLTWRRLAPISGRGEIGVETASDDLGLERVLGTFSIPGLNEWDFLVSDDVLFTRSGTYLRGVASSRDAIEVTGLPDRVQNWSWDE